MDILIHQDVCIWKEDIMPTINQLVTKKRKKKVKKSKSPVLNVGYNTLEREDSWSYYTHSDYPDKLMCIYADSNTFRCTLHGYDREEE